MSAASSLTRADDLLRSRHSVYDAVVLLESADGTRRHGAAVGRMGPNDKFVTGSISKLYVHAIAFALADRGVLSPDQQVARWVGRDTVRGIHTNRGGDSSGDITLRHLVTHTSGLPNLENTRVDGEPSIDQQVSERDREIPLSEVLDLHRRVPGKFRPGTGARAHYSDTNADLLALVLERATGTPYDQLVRDVILKPLGLHETQLIRPETVEITPLHRRRRRIAFPRYLSSQPGSGGVVASAPDLMTFLRAYLGGALFSPEHLKRSTWRRTQYGPLQYGPGLMRLAAPGFLSSVFHLPEIVGHSGFTGSFAFYCPPYETYIVGTTNQMSGVPFEYVYRYLNAFER